LGPIRATLFFLLLFLSDNIDFEITDDTLDTGTRHKEISESIAKDGYWIGPCNTIKFGGWEVVKGEIHK